MHHIRQHFIMQCSSFFQKLGYMSVKERIKKYVSRKKISIREFERLSGLNYGYVNAIRVSIQPDKIESIASYFNDLNIEWLLTGEGEMLKTEERPIDAVRAYYVQAHKVKEYIARLGTLDNKIKVATLLIPHLIQMDDPFYAFDVLDDRLSRGIEPSLRVNDIVIAEMVALRNVNVQLFRVLKGSPVAIVVLSDKYGQLIRIVESFDEVGITLSPTHPLYTHNDNEFITINKNDIKMLAIVKTIIVNNPVFVIDNSIDDDKYFLANSTPL